MAAATAWRVYREFKDALGEKVVNLETDTIKCALFTSLSNCGDVALATAQYATLNNQHANQGAPGYETGGKTVATTWTQATGTAALGCANPAWTATGGSIVARFAVLYSDTATNKDLIAYCILDSAPADITCTVGNTFTIQINASGVITLAGAEA
jgi:hypothetical protein